MTKKKKCLMVLIICLGCVGAAVGVMLVAGLPWIGLGIGSLLSEDPPLPDTTYWEFPFEIVYRIDGKTVTISDVYVCEHDGFEWDEARGKYRTWKGYLKSTGESAIFITEDDDRKIYCSVGDASYYMNDEIYPKLRPLTPRLFSVAKNGDDRLAHYEIANLYNIRMIDWTFSDPIENSFKKQ